MSTYEDEGLDFYDEDESPTAASSEDVRRGDWVDRHGNRIPIRSMSVTRLHRCIQFIRRGASVYGLADQYLPLLQTELHRREKRGSG